MAFLTCDCFSDALNRSVSLNVIIPQQVESRIGMAGMVRGGDHPVLTLLHGYSDNHTTWMRRTSIERYALSRGLAVVMPAADLSFYADMVRGERYWSYIAEELPQIMNRFFHLSSRPEDNFVAGLSMGGYGALKLALHYPERYGAAASLSGVLDIASRIDIDGNVDANEQIARSMHLAFGEEPAIAGTENDLLFLLEKRRQEGVGIPPLFVWCGEEDFLLPQNRSFREKAEQTGVDLTYRESAGSHDWKCWDRLIEQVIDWLPLPPE